MSKKKGNKKIASPLAYRSEEDRCYGLAGGVVRENGADPTEMLHALYPVIESEGKEVCELEEDEIRSFYENSLMKAHRTFGNPRLRPYVERLADIITRRRTLTGREIAEELHALHLI